MNGKHSNRMTRSTCDKVMKSMLIIEVKMVIVLVIELVKSNQDTHRHHGGCV